MRSIFAKIVYWFVATVALSLVGYVTTWMFLSARISGRESFNPRFPALFLDDARRALDTGGPARLNEYLKRLSEYSDAEYFLTDNRGKDLVTGEDRSALFDPCGRRASAATLVVFTQERPNDPGTAFRRPQFSLDYHVAATDQRLGLTVLLPLGADLDGGPVLCAGRASGLTVAKPAPGPGEVWTR